jgi:Na+-transporting NADH:ubiquinone oxidoreductase subunit F
MAADIVAPRSLGDYSLVGPYSKLAVDKGLADARWYLSPVPKEKMRALLERRDGPAVRDTIIWFALLIGSGALGIALWGTLWAIFPFLIYGIIYGSSSDSRWHEAGHGTAFKTDWMNNALYEIASFMVMRESIPWRWSHARHHSDTIIVGRDAEIALQRPVHAGKFAGKFFAWPAAYYYFKGVFRHVVGRMAPEEKSYIPETEFGKVFTRARIYLGIYIAVIALAIGTGSIIPLLLVGLPNFYGSWLMVVYGLTQHAGLLENVLDHRLNTRTVYMNFINRYLYWNMGYHIEHHMFPMVPYHNLPKLHALVRADMPPPYHGLVEAYREIIPTLRRVFRDPNYYLVRPLPESARPSDAPHQADVIASDAAPDAQGWVEAFDLSRLVPGDSVRFDHSGKTYAIYRSAIGQLFASEGHCTHGKTHLADGLLQGTCIECPKHNGRFELRDGSVRRPPPRIPLKVYPVREKGGKVLLNVSTTEGNNE